MHTFIGHCFLICVRVLCSKQFKFFFPILLSYNTFFRFHSCDQCISVLVSQYRYTYKNIMRMIRHNINQKLCIQSVFLLPFLFSLFRLLFFVSFPFCNGIKCSIALRTSLNMQPNQTNRTESEQKRHSIYMYTLLHVLIIVFIILRYCVVLDASKQFKMTH